jgi:hypothetical protein
MATNKYTNAGQAWVIDQLDTAIGTGAAIQSGTGTAAAADTDTDLGTAVGSRQASLTKTQPTADTLQFVGTVAYSATAAITELGLFVDATSGALIQRHVFDAVNVSDGDSIEFTVKHTQDTA